MLIGDDWGAFESSTSTVIAKPKDEDDWGDFTSA